MARKKRELKKGDLVTFSARAANMSDLYRWKPMRGEKPLVGMIVKIRETHKWKMDRKEYIEKKVPHCEYTISWIGGKGPRGRKYWERHFIREDLKFVKKLKPYAGG